MLSNIPFKIQKLEIKKTPYYKEVIIYTSDIFNYYNWIPEENYRVRCYA